MSLDMRKFAKGGAAIGRIMYICAYEVSGTAPPSSVFKGGAASHRYPWPSQAAGLRCRPRSLRRPRNAPRGLRSMTSLTRWSLGQGLGLALAWFLVRSTPLEPLAAVYVYRTSREPDPPSQ